ncbi:MAG TPA: phosphodiester glycosidase family protein [Eubacteriales bacterium]|nr:phosphodiester glycosidase family protein [Eubacteriales bacterium]
MRLKPRALTLLLALFLFFTALPAASRAEEGETAADLTAACVFTLPEADADKEYRLTDGYVESYLVIPDEETLEIALPAGETVQGIYLEWYTLSKAYTIEQYGASGELIGSIARQDFVNCYYPLDASAATVKIVCDSEAALSSVTVYGEGTLPDGVEQWEPTLSEADLLFVASTPEAAVTDFYALLALYTVEHQVPTVLTVIERESRTEQGELLAGLWRMGIRTYPVFGDFYCVNNEAYKRVRSSWGVGATDSFVEDELSAYGEKIIITHEPEEMAFDGASQFTAEVVLDVVDDGDDFEALQKVYCVSSEDGTQPDFSQALIAFDGMSVLEAANDAYLENADMRRFHKTLVPSSVFQLAYTTVGEDAAGDDLLENIDTASLAGYIDPTPSPTPTLEPTATPEPTPTPEPTATPQPTLSAADLDSAADEIEMYMVLGMFVALLLGIGGSLWIVAASYRYMNARYGAGRALITALLPILTAVLLVAVFYFAVRPVLIKSIAEQAFAERIAAITPEPTASPTPEPTATPEPTPEATEDETETAEAGGVDDDQYYRSADDPEEVILVDTDAGHWEYRTDTLSIIIDRYTVEEPKLNCYFVAHIRMRDENGFRTVQAAENRNGMGAVRPWILARETKSVLLITGDNLIESDAGYKGILIRDGIVFQYTSAFGCMAMYPDMTMRLFEKKTVSVDDLLEDGVRDVFSFGPVLVQDGVVNEASGEHRLSRRNNPRTGIGMVEPGHFVAIVVDGRQSDYSVGMLLPEFAELFVDEGCSVAYNLDGGVSACMVFMGEQLNRHGNKRVGTYQDTYQRRVPDGLVWGYSDQVPSEDDPVYNTGTSETATP